LLDSENATNLGQKRYYQDAGIPEYWIVDVAAKIVRIHRLNHGKTYSEETQAKGTIALQAFPEVTIDLGNLF